MKINIISIFVLSSLIYVITAYLPESRNNNLSDKYVLDSLSVFNKTANDIVPEYKGIFLYGSNMGYYKGWKDEELAEIISGNKVKNIEGAGSKSLRPALYSHFLEKYGYDARVKTFAFYDSLGIKDNTVFIGYPSEQQKDSTVFCERKNQISKIFKNLYEPIFIETENGIIVNSNNIYAKYVYEAVTRYRHYIKFWEVWNEPDFDETGAKGWKPRGATGNWFENNPDPCDLKNLKAPVFYYNRILRISYEAIKSVDSNAFVCIGGIGYNSFLDAVCRNTDNPDEGKISDAFPLKAGAYFDCLSFHDYPQYGHEVVHFDKQLMKKEYNRNSDAAALSTIKKMDAMQETLCNYGYDGKTYPKKPVIITEYNIGRKPFKDYIGGEEVQRNYTVKSLALMQKYGVYQSYIYTSSESKKESEAVNEFDVMGLFGNILGNKPYDKEFTSQGIAFKSMAETLIGFRYNDSLTSLLRLPEELNGGAFKDDLGKTAFVLWKKAVGDWNEKGDYLFTLPDAFKAEKFVLVNIENFSKEIIITGGVIKIFLTPKPVIIVLN